MYKCLIIEDEDNSRDLLKGMITKYCTQLEVVGWASGVEDGIALIKQLNPDLLFIDIKINGGTGLDILQKIDFKKLGIIFTTGYNNYALNAIKFSAIDYLLKPIDIDELIEAVNKFVDSRKLQVDERHLSLSANQLSKNEIKTLILPSYKGFTVHNIEDIIHIKSEGNYSTFKIKNIQILASKPIGHFEDMLPVPQFYRIHNRTIVQVSKIKEYIKGNVGLVVMEDGERFDVSVRRKEGLLSIIQNH